MPAHTAHLILPCFQIVEHLGLVIKLGVDGQRLHRHTHRMQEPLVRTSIVDGGKQRLLFIIIFCKQETIGRCEEIALEDALFLAKAVNTCHIHTQRPHHRGLTMLWLFKVWHQLGKTITAVEVLCIPLFAFLESRRLPQLSLCFCHLCHRHSLRFQHLSVVGFLHICQHDLQCRTVTYDMVDVEEEIEVLRILEQADVEQTVVVDVKRHNHLQLPGLDV